MYKARYIKMDGSTGEELTLPAALFDGVIHEGALHQAVTAYLSNQRQGTVGRKNRSAVAGGSRKPWRQKGTGRARQGDHSCGPVARRRAGISAADPFLDPARTPSHPGTRPLIGLQQPRVRGPGRGHRRLRLRGPQNAQAHRIAYDDGPARQDPLPHAGREPEPVSLRAQSGRGAGHPPSARNRRSTWSGPAP